MLRLPLFAYYIGQIVFHTKYKIPRARTHTISTHTQMRLLPGVIHRIIENHHQTFFVFTFYFITRIVFRLIFSIFIFYFAILLFPHVRRRRL